MVFDLLALSVGRGAEKPDIGLVRAARNLLKDLFSAKDIAKVGWSFTKSDLHMLRISGGG